MSLPLLFGIAINLVFSQGFSIPFSNKQLSSSRQASHLQAADLSNPPVLITFDLDDTLFPISPVIKEANGALLQELRELGYGGITEESMIASTKAIRQELREEGVVVTYTELRKRAVEREMLKHEKDEESISKDLIERLYNVWESERHVAAERHIFSDTLEMLEDLLETFPDISIGAITNGKGNPFAMKETIHKYFDFCISGEDEGVFPSRKPDSGIFNSALQTYWDMKKCDSDTMDALKDLIWIHVGDDLANDIYGGHKAGAKSIFVNLNESYGQTAGKRFVSSPTGKDGLHVPAWSTISQEEAEKREKLNREALTLASQTVSTLSSLPLAVAKIINDE